MLCVRNVHAACVVYFAAGTDHLWGRQHHTKATAQDFLDREARKQLQPDSSANGVRIS